LGVLVVENVMTSSRAMNRRRETWQWHRHRKSPFHLTNSSIREVGITDCRKLRNKTLKQLTMAQLLHQV